MVFFYTLASVPAMVCYVGRDKEENEDLIKYGWPEDIWFHVDGYSSAHIYVRLLKGQTIDDLSEAVIEECCQLTKANSIEGCKLPNIKVVYTPWANLKKTGDMATGQVGFHKRKEVRSFMVAKKKSDIINPLEKSKIEKPVDLAAEREQRDKEERHEAKMAEVARREQEKKDRVEREKANDIKNYVGFMDSSNMTSNKDGVDLDDFM
eukprot:TRINITY_DN57763_c0_g1_i1.p1 TRINITY_DN57763_c0_g1~~TRINITY_DN57763_c0_g1_i1.p1  ORF type:complete len:207 (+),score=102.48 TRINITY_DN57763_c0_g1_i1:61-681(+)